MSSWIKNRHDFNSLLLLFFQQCYFNGYNCIATAYNLPPSYSFERWLFFFFNHFRTDAFSTFTLVKELFQYFYQYAWTCTTLQKDLFFKPTEPPTHLDVHSVPALVVALYYLRNEGVAAGRAADTLEMRHRTGAPSSGVAPPVQGQRLDVPKEHAVPWVTSQQRQLNTRASNGSSSLDTMRQSISHLTTLLRQKKKLQETTYNQDNTTTKQTYSPLYEAQGATANRERHAANWRSRSILKTQVSSCGEGSVFTGESDLKADIHTVTSLRYGAVQPIRGRHEFVKQTKLTQTRRNFVHNKNNNNEKYV